MSISAISAGFPQISQVPGAQAPAKNTAVQGASDFENSLQSMLEQVDGAQHQGDVALQDLAAGDAGIHETMIALTQADITLQAASTARNKVVSAYETIMNMAI
ncbi:MAG: flagellar hook-basal body complex protein FliE [Myxococcota bacterium]|nr:flagellar hook-basal body complex protein FliE [Myxococcota bacterium]